MLFLLFFLLLSEITRIAILMLPLTASKQRKLVSSVLHFRMRRSGVLPICLRFVLFLQLEKYGKDHAKRRTHVLKGPCTLKSPSRLFPHLCSDHSWPGATSRKQHSGLTEPMIQSSSGRSG